MATYNKGQTPDDPQFVQDQQQISLAEIDWDLTTVTHSIATLLELQSLFNKLGEAETQGVTIPAGLAEQITIVLKSPLLIGRISMLSDPSYPPQMIEVDVVDIEGNTSVVLPEATSTGTGLDSKNFTPIMAAEIIIKQNASAAADTVLFELIIQKVHGDTLATLPLLSDQSASYVLDGTTTQQVLLDKGGMKLLQWLAHSDDITKPHIYTLDYSFDNVHWYNGYTSPVAEVNITRTLESAARFWKLSSDAVAGAHNVDLILASIE